MDFQTQAENYMSEIASTVRSNTVRVYRSLLDNRILPVIGGLSMSEVNNKTAKMLVGRLAEAHLRPATITLAVGLVKQIVKSATDDEGNRLYPVQWNPDFIKAPKVNPKTQKAPVTPSHTLSGAISATSGEVKALVALLGGSGLRIGEALALGVGPGWQGNVWDPAAGTLLIRATMVRGHLQLEPKTEAGNRVVDLHPDLNTFLYSQFANRESGMLFQTSLRTLYRRIAALGIEGFHSMRRFRITHQQLNNVPHTLVKYAAGHAAEDVTERYTKVGSEIDARRKWAADAGLGFAL